MRRLRRSLVTLVALGAIASSVQAGTRPAASRGFAAPAAGLSRALAQAGRRLWERLEGLRSKNGSGLDPSGNDSDGGSGLDPSGQNPPPSGSGG